MNLSQQNINNGKDFTPCTIGVSELLAGNKNSNPLANPSPVCGWEHSWTPAWCIITTILITFCPLRWPEVLHGCQTSPESRSRTPVHAGSLLPWVITPPAPPRPAHWAPSGRCGNIPPLMETQTNMSMSGCEVNGLGRVGLHWLILWTHCNFSATQAGLQIWFGARGWVVLWEVDHWTVRSGLFILKYKSKQTATMCPWPRQSAWLYSGIIVAWPWKGRHLVD